MQIFSKEQGSAPIKFCRFKGDFYNKMILKIDATNAP